MYDRGLELVWLAEDISESLSPEEKAGICAAMLSVSGELRTMEDALSREASGREGVFSMEVVCMGRALDDFMKDPSWDDLSFPEGDGGDVLIEQGNAVFLAGEEVMSRWFVDNVCGVNAVLLRRGGFMPIDNLVESRFRV